MLTTVTKETFAQFIHTFSQQLLTQEKIFVETLNEDELYVYSSEYTNGRSEEGVPAETFISDLKKRYDYPQA